LEAKPAELVAKAIAALADLDLLNARGQYYETELAEAVCRAIIALEKP
jgi:hypothetical protein